MYLNHIKFFFPITQDVISFFSWEDTLFKLKSMDGGWEGWEILLTDRFDFVAIFYLLVFNFVLKRLLCTWFLDDCCIATLKVNQMF